MTPFPDDVALRKTEAADAEKVDEALRAIRCDDHLAAESMLLEVARRSPSPQAYTYRFEDAEGRQFIKFWDQHEFLHYVTFAPNDGKQAMISWIKSAYPRAFFHLGFLKVKCGELEQAVAFLDAGLALEPANPKFLCEKAQALNGLKRFDEALALYRSIRQIGPHVTAHDLAVAWRGQGFTLIGLADLDAAEQAFHRSLEIEPESELARSELAYIAHLRRGGREVRGGFVVSKGFETRCSVCGKPIAGRAGVHNDEGKVILVCEGCQPKKKRWWEFWM